MKITASVYMGNGWQAIALYSFFDDLYRKPFKEKGMEHVAHASYGFEGKNRSLDVFLAKNLNSKNLEVLRNITASDIDPSVDLRNNIKYILKGNLRDTPLERELISTIRADIRNFCENPAKINETTKKHVRKIIPITKANYIIPKKLLEDGKKEFVPACILRANLDFSRGCIAGFIPEKNSSFDGEYFKNFFLDISSECEYCYAIYNHKAFPKSLIKIDKAQLKEELTNWGDKNKKVDVLRLGKRTETGSIYTREQLIDTLETCLETGTRIVMPTKYLEFNSEVAELFKKTNSVVLYSIGYDDAELGPLLSGADNEFRLEQAVKYRNAGINSGLYLSIDAASPPNSREIEIMNFAEKNNVPIQFLPIRVFSKDFAKKILGKTWASLKHDKNQLNIMDDVVEGGYSLTGNALLSAEHIDDFWKKAIKDNDEFYRMCHHNSENTYCGTCFIRGGSVTFTPEVKIDYKNKRKAETYNEKTDKNQIRMFTKEHFKKGE